MAVEPTLFTDTCCHALRLSFAEKRIHFLSLFVRRLPLRHLFYCFHESPSPCLTRPLTCLYSTPMAELSTSRIRETPGPLELTKTMSLSQTWPTNLEWGHVMLTSNWKRGQMDRGTLLRHSLWAITSSKKSNSHRGAKWSWQLPRLEVSYMAFVSCTSRIKMPSITTCQRLFWYLAMDTPIKWMTWPSLPRRTRTSSILESQWWFIHFILPIRGLLKCQQSSFSQTSWKKLHLQIFQSHIVICIYCISTPNPVLAISLQRQDYRAICALSAWPMKLTSCLLLVITWSPASVVETHFPTPSVQFADGHFQMSTRSSSVERFLFTYLSTWTPLSILVRSLLKKVRLSNPKIPVLYSSLPLGLLNFSKFNTPTKIWFMTWLEVREIIMTLPKWCIVPSLQVFRT